ncbi:MULTISPECIES: hypothetical protein [unclassified Aureimonas]|uniref:hypothetical protein n=1 Tax=unclassified Aureimonas TaxID=2615206 RepID=UPI0006F8001C|nr:MULTISPECIES: hypothetical protein [unclassified Aureimonas]KQT64160.1 hypothetical protein ASG62_03955 [Aureimonas sp. Leaf427]KQT81349.1 hypothetical protein ASG54_01225 [Aureimonas sp. Leaf460]
MPAHDLAPDYRSRILVRDLQAFAADPRDGYGLALRDDTDLRRFAADLRAGDWHRLADADPDDLAARLPDWRERGRALLARDTALVSDYAAAQAGDDAARDRLRAPLDEGGYGEPDLAGASAWDTTDRSGMSVAEAAADLASYAEALAKDSVEYVGDDEDCDDYPDDADCIRDYEEGDAPGRYYR